MNKIEAVKKPKVIIDTNPNSKSNKEFRERHDISVSMFNRLTKQYSAQYG